MIRFFDIILSITGITLFSPFFVIILLINLIATWGRPFFVQERIGKNGLKFNLIKFRTMHYNPDNNFFITVGPNDKRITRFGYYLRKYKLDEVPQLINVLVGDMSLVGPRPEVLKYVNLYNSEQKKILRIRPGLTDYASIEYFNEGLLLSDASDPEKKYIEEILPRKIELNQKFISKHSLKQYFLILFFTVRRIFKT